ncbi:MAG: AAA domain-containing protein [Candidatus Latescibacteria bacterium]|nr:AAA domain-containing protein [Candidatus Latescibacterota bacterium]NIM22648.1 AAA domain-containing protein [Candidatus Latescibacterota bacterium]NIM64937.1 AAA domain-containing protein [Candidatus Latescibacterota bacterium]NIO01452.1 AAA domain-containing protein [Candidatus Latescibacterota bacterium]NIO27962.1 AAA domain-containing protein [Candidatus Latescibacterota bacterium]
MTNEQTPSGALGEVRRVHEAYQSLKQEIGKVIVGQQQVIEELMIALFSGGHCLLVGVPGLAKTLLISTVAKALDLKFSRIQFTPDLMPSDITGTDILEEEAGTGKREFRFIKGPVFANVILADEINRTPPKTQSALLQAMQEHQVTAGGRTFDLELPFFVLATQNPIEQEGTYPLPEAQLDRFMFHINVDYPSEPEELEIVETTTSRLFEEPTVVLRAGDILQFQSLIKKVPISKHVLGYAIKLVRATRDGSIGQVKEYVSWGAGPRAGQHLILGSKVRAIMDGRPTPSCDDVRAIAHPVLRHRIVTNFNADADGISTDELIRLLLGEVKE